MLKTLLRYLCFPAYVYKNYLSIRQIESKLHSKESNTLILKNAVVLKMAGGLTNQMICYMAGRYLADIKKASLIIDTTFYTNTEEGRTNRNLQITNYNIRYDVMIPDSNTSQIIKKSNNITFYDRNKLSLLNNDPKKILDELSMHNIINIDIFNALEIRDAATQYAKRNGILTELTLDYKSFFTNTDYNFLNQIKQTTNSVAIHVRRGDFLTNEGGQSVISEFYQNAINEFESKLSDGQFFVFSDDIQWCKDHLRSVFPIFFADFNDDRNGFKDMYLASQCKHFILTQASTFGHQLELFSQDSPDKIVIRSSEEDKMRNQS